MLVILMGSFIGGWVIILYILRTFQMFYMGIWTYSLNVDEIIINVNKNQMYTGSSVFLYANLPIAAADRHLIITRGGVQSG